jgi:hypothetical protein
MPWPFKDKVFSSVSVTVALEELDARWKTLADNEK